MSVGQAPKVVERTYYIDVPKVREIDVETTKYVVKEEETVKFIPKEKETVVYVPKEVETIKYVPEEKFFEKPVIVDVSYERPVIYERRYEKPVITEKNYTFINEQNVQLMERFAKAVQDIARELPALDRKLENTDFKLVESVIHFLKSNGLPTREG